MEETDVDGLSVFRSCVPADVVTSYQGLLCSLARCSLPAQDVIQEKGGLQLARYDISAHFAIHGSVELAVSVLSRGD